MIYAWHTIFCGAYFYFGSVHGGDAFEYYDASITSNHEFSFGTVFVIIFTKLFSVGLNLSVFNIFLIFNIFGVIGLIAFNGSLNILTINKSRKIQIFSSIIIFLPSISFWSSAIGKDGLAFMATCLSLWAMTNIRRRYFMVVFSVVTMLLVRPHIAAILVTSIFIAASFDRKIPPAQRFSIGFLAFCCAATMIPLALTYSGVTDDDNQVGDISEYINKKQEANQEGDGAIDISSMNPPMQLFSYIFRPLPFEAHSLTSFAASIDNLLLLLLFLLGGQTFFKNKGEKLVKQPVSYLAILFFSIISLAILASTTANSGIAVRQKWMFLPMIIFLIFSIIEKPRIK